MISIRGMIIRASQIIPELEEGKEFSMKFPTKIFPAKIFVKN